MMTTNAVSDLTTELRDCVRTACAGSLLSGKQQEEARRSPACPCGRHLTISKFGLCNRTLQCMRSVRAMQCLTHAQVASGDPQKPWIDGNRAQVPRKQHVGECSGLSCAVSCVLLSPPSTEPQINMAHGRLIRFTAVLFSLCECLLSAQARLLNLSGDPATLFVSHYILSH